MGHSLVFYISNNKGRKYIDKKILEISSWFLERYKIKINLLKDILYINDIYKEFFLVNID